MSTRLQERAELSGRSKAYYCWSAFYRVYLRASALQQTLLGFLYEAWSSNLSYSGLVEILAAAYGYVAPRRWLRAVSLARSLISALGGAVVVDPTLELTNAPAQLRRAPGSAIVVDCLGLPELYWVFKLVRERCLWLAVTAYVNADGKTLIFKRAFGGETMLDVTKQLGGQLFNRIDEILHTRLEQEPRELEELIREMGMHFKPVAESIARAVADGGATAVAADHGYDIVKEEGLYSLSHGGKKGVNALSRLAPLLVVTRA
jgi:hypothetical protein